MTIHITTYETGELRKNSVILRMYPTYSKWLLNAAMHHLCFLRSAEYRRIMLAQKKHIDFSRKGLTKQLEKRLKHLIRHKYGNPIIIWFLLNVIMPIVIRIVINWWLKRLAKES